MTSKPLIEGYIYFTLKSYTSCEDEWKKSDYKDIETFIEDCGEAVFSCARTGIEEYSLYKKFKAEKIYYCFKTGKIVKTRTFDSSREDILDIVGLGTIEDEIKFAPCVID